MNTVVLGGRLTLSCPDGFHVMDGEEKKNVPFFDGKPGECLSDPERHILISVGRKPIGGVSAFLISAKDAARRMEASVREPMRNYEYRLHGFMAKSVGSETAEGFGYEYESQGVRMYGESFVVKHDKTLFYLNFYARRELSEERTEVWNRLLSSAKWS